MDGHLALLDFPAVRSTRDRRLRCQEHLIIIINRQELRLDVQVVWLIHVVEGLDVVEDVLNFANLGSRTAPQLAARVFQALRFDVLHLVDGVVALLSPLEFLIQKVEHREIKGPDVISASKFNILVGVQGREGDGASEICLLALGHGVLVGV